MKSFFKRSGTATAKRTRVFAAATALALGAFVVHSPASIIKTDIIFVVDASSSLETVVQNIGDSLGTLATEFDALGVDARYGLVTFYENDAMPRVSSDLTDLIGITDAFDNFNTLSRPIQGGFSGSLQAEPLNAGIAVALNGVMDMVTDFGALGPQLETVSFRPDAIKNLIVIADEPEQSNPTTLVTGGDASTPLITVVGEYTFVSNPSLGPFPLRTVSYPDLENLVANSGPTLVNAITPFIDDTEGCGEIGSHRLLLSGSTPEVCRGASYFLESLVRNSGGNFFDVGVLNSTDQAELGAFVTQFAGTKFQELVDICTTDSAAPGCAEFDTGSAGDAELAEPATVFLLTMGVLVVARRRRGNLDTTH